VGAATGLRPAPLLAGVAAAGVLVATVMTGPDAGAEVRTGRVSVDYSCRLPAASAGSAGATGSQQLTASLVQDYPAAATAGGRVRPGPVTIETSLPRALLPAGASSVSGSAALGVAISGATRTAAGPATTAATAGTASATPSASGSTAAAPQLPGATVTLRTSRAAAAEQAGLGPGVVPNGSTLAVWPGLAIAPVALGTAAAVLTATGQVPFLTAGRAGTTLMVTPVALTLQLRAGSATVQLDCVLGRAAPPLAEVPVTSASSPTARASAAPSPNSAMAALKRDLGSAAKTPSCSASPTGQLNPADLPTPPPGSTVYPPVGQPPPDTGVECAYAVGYANVGKLGEASLVNNPKDDPGLATLGIIRDIYNFTISPPYLAVEDLGNLTLPPADTTFLTYGFIPTTAKMQLIPQGALTVVNTGAAAGEQSVTTIYGAQSLHLYDVAVDGTALNVGSDCRTVSPLQLRLVGIDNNGLPNDNPDDDYTITDGGPLSQDQLTIPYFTGCGPAGSLDPLFDAAVSGSGNSLNLLQGPICDTLQEDCSSPTSIPMPGLPVRAPKTSK